MMRHQCDTQTIDLGNPTRCTLDSEHPGLHDDGAIQWRDLPAQTATPATLTVLCVVVERLREENPNLTRLAFTLPEVGNARVEVTFPERGAASLAPKEPSR